MFQVRFHGRGGQGAVTAAELLSIAAFLEGKHAQAFPSFGPERSGAPVAAFCRIDDRPIRLHEPIVDPDAVIVQDATLLRVVDAFQGLTSRGYALLNTTQGIAELGVPALTSLPPNHARAIPASDIARDNLGKPLPNAALLGGLAALTKIVSLDALLRAIDARFEGAARVGNEKAARAAFDAIAKGGPC